MLRKALPALIGAAICCAPGSAVAQRNLSQRQSDTWYVMHGAWTAFGAALSLGVMNSSPEAPLWERTLGFERRTRQNYAPRTARATDVTLSSAMVAPLMVFAGSGDSTRFLNSSIVYGETLTASVALNSLTKVWSRRSRPYVFNVDPQVQKAVGDTGADAHHSFYSGHSSTSFVAATAGGLLFSASNVSLESKSAFWAVQMALAGFTAHGRVRSGSHYPTDVVVGALAGVGVGVLVPAAHQIQFDLHEAEWASIAGGVVLGTSAAFLFPRAPDPMTRISVVPSAGGAVLRYSGRFR